MKFKKILKYRWRQGVVISATFMILFVGFQNLTPAELKIQLKGLKLGEIEKFLQDTIATQALANNSAPLEPGQFNWELKYGDYGTDHIAESEYNAETSTVSILINTNKNISSYGVTDPAIYIMQDPVQAGLVILHEIDHLIELTKSNGLFNKEVYLTNFTMNNYSFGFVMHEVIAHVNEFLNYEEAINELIATGQIDRAVMLNNYSDAKMAKIIELKNRATSALDLSISIAVQLIESGTLVSPNLLSGLVWKDGTWVEGNFYINGQSAPWKTEIYYTDGKDTNTIMTQNIIEDPLANAGTLERLKSLVHNWESTRADLETIVTPELLQTARDKISLALENGIRSNTYSNPSAQETFVGYERRYDGASYEIVDLTDAEYMSGTAAQEIVPSNVKMESYDQNGNLISVDYLSFEQQAGLKNINSYLKNYKETVTASNTSSMALGPYTILLGGCVRACPKTH